MTEGDPELLGQRQQVGGSLHVDSMAQRRELLPELHHAGAVHDVRYPHPSLDEAFHKPVVTDVAAYGIDTICMLLGPDDSQCLSHSGGSGGCGIGPDDGHDSSAVLQDRSGDPASDGPCDACQ